MWALPTFLFFVAFFHRPAPGIIARELMQAFDTTGATIGLLAAAYFHAYAALMIPAGVLIDAYGARRVVAAGGAVMGLGALVMGAAGSVPALFAGRVVVGLGATVTFVGALKVAAVWFPPSRFGTLSAVTATVGVLGALAAAAPLAWLVGAIGWRGALALVGVATLAGSALCAWRLVDHPPGAGDGAAPPPLGEVIVGMARVLANPHTWPPFLAFFCIYAAWGNLQLWIVPFLRDVYGMTTTAAAALASAPALALLVTGPLTGWVSDRVARRRRMPYLVLTAASFVLWVVFVATLGGPSPAALFALLFLLGVVGGAFVLTWPIGREVNPPALAAVAVAVVNLGGFLGAAVTQGPLGVVLDAGWEGQVAAGARLYPLAAYRTTFAVCAVFALLAALLALPVRETHGRNIYGELRRPGGR
jgi:sugar phosphate permease